MGPTYLALLVEPHGATVLYTGTDEAEARNAYDKAVRSAEFDREHHGLAATVYLTTVRAEAKLS